MAHPGLAWLAESERGSDWLAALPQLVDECAEQWSLKLGEPFPYAVASLAIPAGDAVLKIQFPDRESEHEAEALDLWNGEGAARLLAYDSARRALLLERCRPGTPLAELPADEALDVAVELLPRLWQPAGAPFRPLADEAAWWVEGLRAEWEEAGRPFERGLLDEAMKLLGELAASQGEQVLLSQDFHAGNVLRAKREPWLAIDPKPLAGEREFGIAALVRGRELGHGEREVRHRLDRLTGELGLDRERARGWAIGQTIAWGIRHDEHAEVARWLLRC